MDISHCLNNGSATLADFVREKMFSEFDDNQRQQIYINTLKSHRGALREKIFIYLRSLDGCDDLSDSQIFEGVDEFIAVMMEKPQ